jgi:hypothetical protein
MSFLQSILQASIGLLECPEGVGAGLRSHDIIGTEVEGNHFLNDQVISPELESATAAFLS